MQLTNAEMAERLQDQEDLGVSIGKAQAQARIDALESEVARLKDELQEVVAQLYPHSLYTFYQAGTGAAMPMCWYCRRYEYQGYCAERHRQALAKSAKASSIA